MRAAQLEDRCIWEKVRSHGFGIPRNGDLTHIRQNRYCLATYFSQYGRHQFLKSRNNGSAVKNWSLSRVGLG